MLFTNITQFIVLGLLVFVGWLFGLASHPGGKRWRRAYEDETIARASDRDELDTQLRAQDKRIKALEAEKAELEGRLGASPVAVAAAAPVALAAVPAEVIHHEPVAVEAEPVVVEDSAAELLAEQPVATTEAEPLPIKRGWFDWGVNDDLSRMRGIDADMAGRLKAEGISSFAELGNLNDEQEIALERRLDLPAGYLMKEEVREQARMLAEGQADAHAARFAAG